MKAVPVVLSVILAGALIALGVGLAQNGDLPFLNRKPASAENQPKEDVATRAKKAVDRISETLNR